MADYRIVPTRGQFVAMAISNLLVLVMFVLSITSALVLDAPTAWLVASVVMAAGQVALIGLSFRFATVLTERGVTAVGLLTRRFAWDDIAEIEVVRRHGSFMAQLTLTDGRKRRLRVPVAGSSFSENAFYGNVHTIWTHWTAATGRAPAEAPALSRP
ncbi:PH domain-containing protein [Streptomycetaceae bacterium NBC_01309]